MKLKNLASEVILILIYVFRINNYSKTARDQFKNSATLLLKRGIRVCGIVALCLTLQVSNSFGQKVSKASGALNALTTWTDLVAGTGNITIVAGNTAGTNATTGSIAVNDALFDNSNNFIGIVSAVPTTTTFTLQNGALTGVAGAAFRKQGVANTVSAPVAGDYLVIRAAAHTITVSAAFATNNTIVNNGIITTASLLTFNSGSTYIHYRDGGTIPVNVSWNVNSTCRVIGNTGTNLTNIAADPGFGNFVWNSPAQSGTIRLTTSAITITVNGNMDVLRTNGNILTLSSNNGSKTLQVNGNLTVGNGVNSAIFDLKNNGNTSNILNLGGNLQVLAGATFVNGSGINCTVNFGFTGALANTSVTWGGSGTYSNANLNYVIQNVPAGKTVNLSGFNGSTITFPGTGTLTVNNLATLNCGTQAIAGTGTFTLQAGGILGIGHINGINGNLTITAPVLNAAGAGTTFVYNGIAPQVTGTNLPATVSNLTINNSTGVTLSANVTASNLLTFTSGNVTTGATFVLALSNPLVGSLTRVSGTVIGKIRRAIDNATLLTDYTFPVGTAGFYRPAVMDFSALGSALNITAEFIATPPGVIVPYIDGTVNLNNTFTEGYWRFISSATPAATYSIKLTGNGFASYTLNELTRITARDAGDATWRGLGSHGTWSGSDLTRLWLTNLNATSFDYAFATGCATTTMGYSNERNITIDHTKVSGGSDLSNFPVLINLTGQTFLKSSPTGKIMNPNAWDLIFTDNDYNKLDHQIEYYNGANGDLIAWVRVPTLSSSSNTVIKILYGNSQVSTDPSVTSVWDSHYKGVWHLDNDLLKDFTAFNKSGTSTNAPTYLPGTIYNSLGLSGSNQYVTVINDPNINFNGNVTVSAWAFMNTGGLDQKIVGNQTDAGGGYKFGIYTNNEVEFEIRDAANTPSLNRGVAGGTILNTGTWYYLAGNSSDVLDSIRTFVNGVPERPYKYAGALATSSNDLVIGKEPFTGSFYFNGRIDELRISDEVRSNGWLKTEYNNQSSPATFYSIDAADAVSNSLPAASLCGGSITLDFGYPTGGTYTGNPFIFGNIFTPLAAGTYPVTYTFNGGCGPSSVTKDFIITDQPGSPVAANKEYCTGTIAYLQTTYGDNVKWYLGGVLVSTANPFSTGQTAVGTYNYTVTQTINGCESDPVPVTLSIFSGTSITTQPVSASKCVGDNVSFSVTATGPNLTYQWKKGAVNVVDGGTVSGSTTPTLSISNVQVTDAGSYTCVVSSSCGAPLTSNIASLVVDIKPTPSIAGNNIVCQSSTIVYNIITVIAGHTYNWTVTNGTQVGLNTGTTYTVTWPNAGTGTVSVTETVSSGCSTTTPDYIVSISATPSATISYAGSPFCTSAGIAAVTLTGSGGGTFSSTAGLFINASTGDITPGLSTPGTYTVTYTIPASGGCLLVSTTTQVTINLTPVAPTGSAAQSFCSVTVPTVANLTATGTAIKWYAASSGGTELVPATVLGNGTHYYASQTVGGCESALRFDVTVTINTTPVAPTGLAAQSFCAGSLPTVASLSATGSGILWYAASSGGIALATSTVLVNGTHYYASQTVNGCESTLRFDVTVTINATPSAPTGAAAQAFCSGALPTVAQLTATGTAIQWYAASSGGAALAGSTAVVNGTHYYASQTVTGCESSARFDVTATVNTTPVAPTGAAAQTFCSSASPTIADLTATGTVIQWYSSPVGGIPLVTTTFLGNGNHYYASQTVSGCESILRFDVLVTVNTTPFAPIGTAAQSFCSGSSPTVLDLTATGTAIQWYAASSGGAALLTSTPLINGTHYFASQTISGCESTLRFDVTVTVNTSPAAPTGSSSQTFCSGGSPTIADLIATGTAINWYAASSGGAVLLTSTPLVNGNHYYATQTVNTCESTSRFDVTVTINPTPPAPTGSVSQTFCSGALPTIADLTATGTLIQWYSFSSGGAVLPTSTVLGNGTHYYASQTVSGCESTLRLDVTVTVNATPVAPIGSAAQSFCSAALPTVADLTATGISIQWYAASSGGIALPTSTALVNGTHYFATQTQSGCESLTRFDVTVTINTTPSAPTGTSAQSFCSNNSPTIADLSATGIAILWYAAPSGGAALATSTSLITGTHYYASQTITGCESTSRFDVTATINATPAAPTGSAAQSFCSESLPTIADLIATGNGIQWYSAPVGGVPLLSTIFLGTGNHYYASQTVNGCESVPRFDVTVTINTTPFAPTGSAAQSFCSGNLPTVADLLATGTLIQWYAASSGGIAIPTSTALINGNHYFASQTISGCESTTRFDVTVTINTTPAAPAGSSAQSFCSGGSPTVADLTATGNSIQWYAATIGGIALPSSTPLVNGSHYFASQTVTGCESISRFDVTVTVNPTPSAPTGLSSQIFCSSDLPTVANLVATGTAIQWYAAPNGGTALASATVLGNGTHYYASQTVTGCESTSRFDVTATVNVTPAAPTGLPSQSFCGNLSPTLADLTVIGTGIQWYAASGGGSPLLFSTALVNGTHYYASQTFNSCESTSRLDVTAIVFPDNTVTLSSALGSDAQTVCINTALISITYITTGATSASVTGLPAGVNGSWLANVVTISGTPSVAGPFTYTVTLTGGCGTISTTGTISVSPDNTVLLTSGAGSDTQTLCINTPLINITYSTTGATGATVSGLPLGVNGSWLADVVTISGTPTVSGPFNYTVTLTGGCGTITTTGTISVTPDNTITITSGVGSDAQTLCINTALTTITYITTGATGATITGLPAGVTGSWLANVVIISGTPTVSGPFSYTVTLTGGCGAITATGTITVTANMTVGAASSTPTLCINTPLTSITHATTLATGIGVPVNLPAGVTASFAGNTITIIGTPTAVGVFNYTIPLTGGCGAVNATGTITVTANMTVGAASSTPTLCINTPLTAITHATTLATGIGVPVNLPAGVTASFAGNTITIIGTPTAVGVFNYTIPLTGGCGAVNATGTITVTANMTVGAASSTPTLCINTPLTAITHATTLATGIGVPVNLPAGVTASFAGNTITIIGTPTAVGVFNYTIPLTGGCGAVNATGTITVTANMTVGAASSTPTLCINTPLTAITHATTLATGIGVPVNLPAGVTASFAGNTITIIGTPTAVGVFNYTIPLTGGCGAVNATGTITVTANMTVGAASSTPTLCINTPLTAITHATTLATGIGVPVNLPAGVTASFAGNTITIIGTPTAVGVFNYTIPLTGGCGAVNATGTITVTANMTVGAASSTPTLCINTPLTAITHATTLATGIGVPVNLPAGVTASFAGNTITIIGTPTAVGVFNYTIPLTGGCGAVNATGTITVTANMTVGAASSTPTLCINTPLTAITHATTLATGIGVPVNLPAGVTASFAGNTITIIGTPTAVGVFNYTIPLTGGCGAVNATGTITVTANMTVGAASSTPTLCINTPLTAITHATTLATGIGVPVNLPAGVTASFAGNTITIIGTPTAVGVFNYTIPLTGGCGAVNATGTITVTANMTVGAASSTPTLCINTPLTAITHATTLATGIGVPVNLPAGVTASFAGNTITIIGTPTAVGVFNYTIPLTGGCGAVNATGTITVTANMTVGAASSTPTLCINTPLTAITHATTLATGIGVPVNLPAGVTASFAGNTITIIGTPTAVGVFNYTIPLTGGCGAVNATGTITVTANMTVGAASSTPTLCINTPLTAITHATTLATGIGVPVNLPAGVTASFAGNTITIIGTPTAVGVFNYTIPLTGGCGAVNATGTITVTANMTVGAASSTPTLCINTPLTAITHATTLATGIGVPVNLPAGVTASFAGNTITIIGTPTAVGVFNYTIPLTGGCGAVNATGTITVTANMTVGAASSTPTLCINTPLTAITHATTLATGIGVPVNLPAGVTASFAGNTITIIGTPTAVGVFNYTIPLTGGCGAVNATGTITVTANMTVGAASSTPTLCINTPLTAITHATTLATGIGVPVNLPAGVTASFAGNTITIIGTPTAVGVFNYTIPLTGGCGAVNATGTITVTANMTVGAASSTPTLCINTPLTAITHATTLATGIGVPVNLPAGVTASFAGNTITIIGTPTAVGVFNYTIPLTGGCGAVNATGTITVTANMTVGAASSTPTLCINTPLTAITHATTLATGIGVPVNLPAGVTASFAGNTITIIGTPTAVGVFNYTIPLTGGCGAVNATGTITVTANMTVGAASSTPTLCINTPLTAITHATTLATGIGVPVNLPAGVTASFAGNTITIIGTPTAVGVFNYTIPLTGGCGAVNATGTITVTANMTVGAASSTPTLCINTPLTAITHATTLATGIGVPVNLPAGVTASFAGNTITIIGTPTAVGVFNYTIPLTGGCGAVNATGTITVTANMTVGAASSTPTLCINTPLTAITHATTLATGIGVPVNLPAGVTASFAGNTITIIGTPTAVGVFNYTIPLTGGCGAVNATGTITVTANMTVGAASSTPTLCINTPLTAITHATTLATGIGVPVNLPAGVTASFAGNTITIIGTPTAVGVFNYTIPLTGGCGAVNATGTITVTANMTVGAASSTPTLCINTPLTAITHATTLATGIGVPVNLPAGVTASFAGNTITIIGTPTAVGVFNYTIPLTGGCGAVNATGTITVTANMTVGAASSTPTLCINTPLTAITHATTLATGIGVPVNLPAGVTASFAGNTITIIGTPTAVGVFNYTIPLTGGCGAVNATGTITVTANMTVGAASSTPTLCINTPLTAITHATTLATGIGVPVNLPAGVTASFAGNTITIIGTPIASGVFNYTIPLTGGCGAINAAGIITVTANNTITRTSGIGSDAQTVCTNTAITTITYATTGATGATFSGLPSGVTGNWLANVVTISGAPSVSGPFIYTVTLTGGCGVITASGTISASLSLVPTFTAEAGAAACAGIDVTYSTQPGQTNYIWTIPGVSGIDYSITSGGTVNDYTVTLKWLSAGSKIVGINYTTPAGCTSASPTFSAATIVNSPPTVANAGPDQTDASMCGLTTTVLAANTPVVGTGSWSIIGGAGGTIIAPASPTSSFTGTAGTAYTLRWTISNLPCGASTDDVNITFNQIPTVANAGADQTDAVMCGLTTTTLAGNAPVIGTGTWSIIGGAGGNVISSNNPTSIFTGVAGTAYTLRWTISNAPCPASIDDVNITFNQAPTVAIAGPDQTGVAMCGLTTTSLAANTPVVGTGVWTITAGAGGVVTTPASPTSIFTGVAGNTYTLTWTISNAPCAASSDDVVITFNQAPTVAAAGPDQIGAAMCGLTTTTLAANTPVIGTGVWSIIAGAGGTVTTLASPTSTFTGVAGSTYTLRWTISNAPCTASTDDVVITFNQAPTVAAAGPDQTGAAMCGLTTTTLAANTPLIGTGTWTIMAGAGGTVTTPASPTSTFTGVAGSTYTLRWTISNAPCIASTDDVVITFNQPPTVAIAGPDQTGAAMCGLTTTTLAANTPVIGTGAWTITAGTGGTVTTPASPISTFTGAAGNSYTLTWTISNAPCTASTDDVVITFNQVPTVAAAGPDQTGAAMCGLTTTTLTANTPVVGTGAWTITAGAGGTVTTPASPTSTFTGVAGSTYTLRWTISNAPCTASTDDVIITFNQAPTVAAAGLDQTGAAMCGLTTTTLAANTPLIGTGAWTIMAGAGGTVTTPASPTSTFTGVAGSTYTLRWTISNSPCTASTDDVVISFNQAPTVAVAGADQTGAAMCGLTATTLAANIPIVGTGTWSIVGGLGGTITAPTSPTSTFTGVPGIAYTLRWTISNAPCAASTDDVNISFNENPTIANAGLDQTSAVMCGLTNTTLSGNTPIIGTGTWSILSGAGGNITAPTSPTSTFTGVAGNTYTLRWTISNAPCTASTDDVVITFNEPPTVAIAGPDQMGAATCGLTTTTLAANTPVVGTGAWTIIAGAGGTVTTPASPTSTFTGVAGNTYTLRWTIINAPCTASSDDVIITFNQPPTVAAAGPDQTGAAMCGLTTATLAANTPVIGTGAWTITAGAGGTVATPASPTSTFTGVAGNTYTLTWTISNAPCTASTDDVVITFNQAPTAAAAGADQIGAATCGLTTTTLSANTPVVGTGAWTITAGAGGTVTTPASPTSTFTGVAGNTYTLTWTISNAPCTASTDDVVITFNQAPTVADAGADQTGAAMCGLTTTTLAANTPVVGTGVWTITAGTGGTVTTPASPTSTFTGIAGNTYTLTWTISNAPCTASTDDVVITFNQAPTVADAGPDQTGAAMCGLTTTTLAANTPVLGTGAWTITAGAGGIVTTPASPTSTFTGVAGNTYTLTWTISNAPCTASTDDVIITFNLTPTVVITDPAAVCSPSTVDLTAAAIIAGSSPGLTYTYWSDALATISVATPASVTGGTYYIEGTDPLTGCSVIEQVVVTVTPSPIVIVTNPPAVCAPLTIDLTVSAITTGSTLGINYTYWTDALATVAVLTPASVTDGTYFIKGTDPGTGCYDIKPVIATVNPLPTLIITDPSACAPSTVDLTAPAVTAGSSPGLTYTYWTDLLATISYATPTTATAGTYYIKGSDPVTGCYDIKPVNVTVNNSPTVTTSQVNVTCFGGATGSATAIPAGGTGVYTYSWNTIPVQTSVTAINLAAGTYIVTVNDGSSCTATASVTITEPATGLSGIITSHTDVSNPGGNDGSITASGSGGTPPYQYSIVAGVFQASGTFGTLTAGSYTVTVQDLNLCQFEIPVTITEPSIALSGSTSSKTDVACFGSSTGSVTVIGSGGIPPYEYSIDAGPYQASGTFGLLAAGTYTITVRDATLNSIDVSVTIDQPASSLGGSITSLTNILCFGNNTGSVTVDGSGGTPPYMYKMGAGAYQVSGTFGSLTAGSYTVTVQDANSCTQEVAVTVNQPFEALSGSISSLTDISCFGSTDGTVTVTASGGISPYLYSLNGGTYQVSGTFSNLSGTTYTVTVQDANQCTDNVSVTIAEPAIITIVGTPIPASCPGVPDGSITLTVTGGTPPYNAIWSDGKSGLERTDIPDTTYSVVVTDKNGCNASKDIVVDLNVSDRCLIIPTIITPNDDLVNDTWQIKNIDLFPNAEVFIFTRWGKLVYHTKNLAANPWNGTFRGSLLPTDSYHYVLHLNDGSKPRSGVISIIR